MALICLTGGLAASFLPETAGSELPETMEEAAEFGKDHGYFSWVMPHHNRAGAKNKVKAVLVTPANVYEDREGQSQFF